MRIVAIVAVSVAIVLAVWLCAWWYIGEPIDYAKIRQIESCSTKQSVLDLLGPPTSIHRDNGNEYWVYHGSFLGIRTVLHLDVIFTNDTYWTWAMMD